MGLITLSYTSSWNTSKNEPIPSIEGDQKLRESLFSLDIKSISELIEFNGKFYIIQIDDKKESYLPELEEVEDQCSKDVIDYLAVEEAQSAAEKSLAELKQGKNWDDFVKEKGLKSDITDFFSRMDIISKIGYAPELQEAAFKLNEGKIYPENVSYSLDSGIFIGIFSLTSSISDLPGTIHSLGLTLTI